MQASSVDNIVCPRCGIELPAAAEFCRKCGAPTSSSAKPARKLLHRPWVVTILLLHLGFLGTPLYWKLPYSVASRVAIIVVSILYTVFAVLVIYWGILQIWRAVEVLQ